MDIINKTVKIIIDDQELDLPVTLGTENEHGIDISKLRVQTGYITLDPGFGNTGATESAITYLDGEAGVLRYRGYPIEQLAEKSSFIEVGYLLFHGEMPNKDQLSVLESKVAEYSEVPEGLYKIFDGFSKDAHPMAMLSAGMMALSGYHQDLIKPVLDDATKESVFAHVIGKMSTLAAAIFKIKHQQNIIAPDTKLSYEDNFLHMLFSSSSKTYQINPVISNALRVLLILHEDHEQNCSTSAVRLVGSSQANIFASLSSGIAALWGPLHGGANQKMIEMLQMIQADGGDFQKYIAKAKDKKDPFRLMGFGHRVYRKLDPRAGVIKSKCDALLDALGVNDPLLDIARELEQIALKDEYFIERKLYPNVDFYSGIMYRAMGIPVEMFTVLFALGRSPGWVSHWKELIESPGFRIVRPRQIYKGSCERSL